MAKIYFKDGNYEALTNLLNSVFENKKLQRIKVFEIMSSYIEKQLNCFYDNFGYTEKTKKEYEKIKEILNGIEEKINILSIEKTLSLSSMETKFSIIEERYSDAYQALYDSEQEKIVPSRLLNHVKNLEIVAEEDYLLCLSAATILFEHNMPSCAEKYLKFVSTSKNKTDTVKEALYQTVKNKKLYLNR